MIKMITSQLQLKIMEEINYKYRGCMEFIKWWKEEIWSWEIRIGNNYAIWEQGIMKVGKPNLFTTVFDAHYTKAIHWQLCT
jgi:hypothetical protein